MVSLSKFFNSGLVLVGQSIFQDVATPEQSATDEYNLIRFLAGSAPYIQNPGFGIDSDFPAQCTIEQVQLFSRHGERYPSLSNGAQLEAIYKKFQNYNQTFNGDLAFLNDYTYFVPDQALYEKETSPQNSEGLYAGTSNAQRHGAAFRARYNSLYNDNSSLLVFTSNSGRVHQTSRYFARGFLGDNYDESKVTYSVISENATQGANSLTPRYGCAAYNSSANAAIVNSFDTSYLNATLARLTANNTGLDLTVADVSNLFGWCAYEVNVRGASPFCNIFTNEEYIRYGYLTDISNYYLNGAGNNMTATVAAPLLEANLALLQDNSSTNNIWLSFSHDTDIEIWHSALGLMEPSQPLPTDHVPFPNPYSHVGIVPQGARTYTEKLKCGSDYYVRFVVNDAVIPMQTCQNGPGFSCKLSDYASYVNERLAGKDYGQQCNVTGKVPTSATFYWDYTNTTYNAPDINA